MKTLIFLLLSIIGFSGWSQQRLVFEAEQVSIIPPPGFKEVDFFTGVFNFSIGASIQLEEVDSIAYLLIAEGFTKEVLEPQGVTLISKEKVKVNEMNGILVTMHFNVTQTNPETGAEETRVYERLTLLTGDMNRSIFISANYAMLVKELVYDAVKGSLLTVRFEN